MIYAALAVIPAPSVVTALDLVIALCLTVLAAAYLVWPAAVSVAARVVRRRPAAVAEGPLPSVDVIVVARDEEAAIAAKIADCLALDYPAELLRIVVVSDGCSDGTCAVVAGQEGPRVSLLALASPLGKTAAAWAAASRSRAEVLVFTDATARVEPGAVRALVDALRGPGAGCATGRVVYTYDDAPLAAGFRSYQGLIVAQRRAEARAGTATVVSGALHATWRPVLAPVDPWHTYDLVLPLLAAEQGLRTVYVSTAVAVEASRRRLGSELRARLRIGMRCWLFLALLVSRRRNIRDWRYLVQVLFHKVSRWLGTVALLVLAVVGPIGLAAGARLAPAAVALVGGLLGAAAAGAMLRPWTRRVPALGLPLFFLIVNVAYVWALVRVLRGDRVIGWRPER